MHACIYTYMQHFDNFDIYLDLYVYVYVYVEENLKKVCTRTHMHSCTHIQEIFPDEKLKQECI